MYPLNRYRTRDRSGALTLFNAASRVLRQFGTDAHLWMPGVGYVNGVTASNWIDSAGTVAGEVDQPVGRVNDSGGGSINATQSTTASKPILRQTSGRYRWQFDGTDDRLSLSSVPFQQAEDHCVVGGAELSTAGSRRVVFCLRNSTNNAPLVAEIGFSPSGFANARWRDDAFALVDLVGSTSLQGQSTVLAARKSGATRLLRANGVQVGSSTTAIGGATTLNNATIGAGIGASLLDPMIGNIYPVIAIKGTVSDADLLTLEKFVGACSGVTI